MRFLLICLLPLLVLLPLSARAQHPGGHHAAGHASADTVAASAEASVSRPLPSDEAAASAAADRFYDAIASGDQAAAERLLLPDALVLEGGAAETRSEYLSHHFGRDAAYLGSVEREPLTRRTSVDGDVAYVASTSRLVGETSANSAELLVLRHSADGWRVAAVHWSSRSL